MTDEKQTLKRQLLAASGEAGKTLIENGCDPIELSKEFYERVTDSNKAKEYSYSIIKDPVESSVCGALHYVDGEYYNDEPYPPMPDTGPFEENPEYSPENDMKVGDVLFSYFVPEGTNGGYCLFVRYEKKTTEFWGQTVLMEDDGDGIWMDHYSYWTPCKKERVNFVELIDTLPNVVRDICFHNEIGFMPVIQYIKDHN